MYIELNIFKTMSKTIDAIEVNNSWKLKNQVFFSCTKQEL